MLYNYRAYMLKETNVGLPLSKVSLNQHWKSFQKSDVQTVPLRVRHVIFIINQGI
jgi:hypothetical protein